MMESSLALGRLELTSSTATVGIHLGQRLSVGPAGREKNGQPPPGPQVPSHLNGCVPLSHQVAGHKYGVDKVGILQHPDGTVLKQLQPPPRGPREMQFYSKVYAEDCYDPCLLELQDHLPKYYGTCSSPDNPSDLYMKLEDVTRRFVKPCIMDVKLGQRSYDPFASQEKRDQQIRKYPLMEEIGFLVLGMRVYKVCSNSFETYDQHYGRGLVKDTVKDGLSKFFHNGAGLRRDAVSASIRRVRHILRWFESQRQFTFYASSLLFVYEGLPSSSSTAPFSASCSSSPGGTEKASAATTVATAAEDARGKGGAEEAEVVEYNNNNIQVGAPWSYSLAEEYANQTKDAQLQYRTKGCLLPPAIIAERQANGNGRRTEETGVGRNGAAVEQGDGNGDGDVEVRMIDFAHVFQSDSPDHGYIYGLKHLLSVLEQISHDSR